MQAKYLLLWLVGNENHHHNDMGSFAVIAVRAKSHRIHPLAESCG
jgi:hypothetical protein